MWIRVQRSGGTYWFCATSEPARLPRPFHGCRRLGDVFADDRQSLHQSDADAALRTTRTLDDFLTHPGQGAVEVRVNGQTAPARPNDIGQIVIEFKSRLRAGDEIVIEIEG